MRVIAGVFGILFSALFCLNISSCGVISPPYGPVVRSNILGAWTLGGPHGLVSTLTFDQDGTVSIQNLPSNAFESEELITDLSMLSWASQLNLKGTWVFGNESDSGIVRITVPHYYGGHKLWLGERNGKEILTTIAGGGAGVENLIFTHQDSSTPSH